MQQHDQHNGHEHRDFKPEERPLDAANQSLADALRSSFSILKGIMVVLVVLYLFSNVRRIDGHEEALRLRLGRLLPGVQPPGLVWSFPFPIDEIVPLPTKKSNEMMIKSHTFARRSGEHGQPLSFISRSPNEGLHPTLDGALLTADAGLIHCQWKVTYKINDVSQYVSEILGKKIEAAEQLIKTMVETVGIQVASELTAEEFIRTRVDHVQAEMRRRINDRLTAIHSGIVVTLVEVFEPTPPIQVRESFDRTQQAENWKQRRIREAEQERTKILNEAAGAAHKRVVALLDEIDATAEGPNKEQLRAELDHMLDSEVEGQAGQLLKDASSYRTVTVSQMQDDVQLYRSLLPEYEHNPQLLIARLWEATKQKILNYPGVTKFYRPADTQLRIHIPLDPEEERMAEKRRLLDKRFDPSKLRPKHWVPVGPEAE